MKIILGSIIFLIFALGTYAQEIIQWKGLKLDISSPQEAITILGKPQKDKIEKPKYPILQAIVSKNNNQTTFREQSFEKIDEFKKVKLTFYNDKLVKMDFEPKKKAILASSLQNIYKSDFLFLEGIAKQMKFSDYIGQKETTVPKVYPAAYYMMAIKTNSGIFASIENKTLKAIWRDAMKKPTLEMFPGYVFNIQIFSRSLEVK